MDDNLGKLIKLSECSDWLQTDIREVPSWPGTANFSSSPPPFTSFIHSPSYRVGKGKGLPITGY